VAAIAADATPRTRSPHRGKRLMVGGGVVVLLAGCVTAAVVFRGQPDRPEFGIACLASSEPGADVVAAHPDADPIAACAALWAEGRLPDPDNPTGEGSV